MSTEQFICPFNLHYDTWLAVSGPVISRFIPRCHTDVFMCERRGGGCSLCACRQQCTRSETDPGSDSSDSSGSASDRGTTLQLGVGGVPQVIAGRCITCPKATLDYIHKCCVFGGGGHHKKNLLSSPALQWRCDGHVDLWARCRSRGSTRHQGSIRMAVHRRRRGGIPPGPLPQTKVTTAGKNEIYERENLVGPFLVHTLGSQNPPFPPSTTSLPGTRGSQWPFQRSVTGTGILLPWLSPPKFQKSIHKLRSNPGS